MPTGNAYAQALHEFVLQVEVECPFCLSAALVQSGHYPPSTEKEKEPRFTCTHCGHSQLLSEKNGAEKKSVYIMGEPVDPYFHLPVWLQIRCGEELLWAYNREHLALLEKHIKAGLRDRKNVPVKNNSIGSRLPRWMTAAKNRERVLKCIHLLQKGIREKES
jgi:hypothetical protein